MSTNTHAVSRRSFLKTTGALGALAVAAGGAAGADAMFGDAPAAFADGQEKPTWGPVSYTHLDVYKRQGGSQSFSLTL